MVGEFYLCLINQFQDLKGRPLILPKTSIPQELSTDVVIAALGMEQEPLRVRGECEKSELQT